MKMKIFELTFLSDRPIYGNTSELMGFFSEKFPEYELLHQHEGGKLRNEAPLIQYKMIGNMPMIIGIGSHLTSRDGVSTLKDIHDKFDEIILGKNVYKIIERNYSIKSREFGISTNMISYEFVNPYYPLSQKNYKRFYDAKNEKEREEQLKSILKGNLIIISKRLNKLIRSRDYDIIPTIYPDIHLKIKGKGWFRGNPFIMFDGWFDVNVAIPDYIGIGGKTAFGFGTVKRLE